MPVASVNELWSGRTGSGDYMQRRTYTRTFEAYTTLATDGPDTAGTSPLLPLMGASHPEDLFAVVVRRTPTQDEADPLRWLVQIDYDSKPDLPTASQPEETGGEETRPDNQVVDPIDMTPVWKFSFDHLQVPLKEGIRIGDDGAIINGPGDVARQPVVNSAGVPFDPPVMIEISRPVVRVTKNFPGFSFQKLLDLQDTVNSAEWMGIPARCARCTGVEANSAIQNGTIYWAHTFTFALNYETWDFFIVDQGFMRLVPGPVGVGGYVLEAIHDTWGNPVGSPVLLDGAGDKLPANVRPKTLRWRGYRELDYNTVVF